MKILKLIGLPLFVVLLAIFSGCDKGESDQLEKEIRCRITHPKTDENFTLEDTLTIIVSAEYTKGIITEAHFFIDDVEVGASTEFPLACKFAAANLEYGLHSVGAEVRTNDGLTKTTKKQFYVSPKVTVAKINISDTIMKVGETTITLSANAPENTLEKGVWTISRGGREGSFADVEKANTVFTGKLGTSYVLRWTISNKNFSSSDEVKVVFRRFDYGSVTDIDGNTYKTVTIGNQEWMTGNLRVTHYPDGSDIFFAEGYYAWLGLSYNSAAYCNHYRYNEVFYTYMAATNGNTSGYNVQGVCPDGWHLPSEEDWMELKNYISDDGYSGREGAVLKGAVLINDSSNVYGFNADLMGCLSNDGYYYNLYRCAYWWGSSQLDNEKGYVAEVFEGRLLGKYHYYNNGYSVRCVKDRE